MRSPEEKRGNCIISKEDFVKEKILGKMYCYEFVKLLSYQCQPNY